jgi:protein-L-isoaspartate O-methyltransferase
MVSDLNILHTMSSSLDIRPDKIFEEYYIVARMRENRIYTDEQTALLPEIAIGHPHHKEWLIRKRSCQKLIRYLQSEKKMQHILEVGCGNGWLSFQLSKIPESRVIGLDINLTELKQAERVFNKSSKLKFVYGGFLSGILKEFAFDVIVFAASLQYFQSLPGLLNFSLQQLNQGGEIHIIDSPFYLSADIPAARERSIVYYTRLGLPELAGYYFHHSLSTFQPFNHKLLFDPYSLKNRLFGHHQPFPWIRIKKD